MGVEKYKDNFKVRTHEKALEYTIHMEKIKSCFCEFYE